VQLPFCLGIPRGLGRGCGADLVACYRACGITARSGEAISSLNVKRVHDHDAGEVEAGRVVHMLRRTRMQGMREAPPQIIPMFRGLVGDFVMNTFNYGSVA
jgi:hypothetical protein